MKSELVQIGQDFRIFTASHPAAPQVSQDCWAGAGLAFFNGTIYRRSRFPRKKAPDSHFIHSPSQPGVFITAMQIQTAVFVTSNTDHTQCPPPDRPEYAFIGRSNVGKSSLINMLVSKEGLAKTSQTPGKTQLINHFLIDDTWYLVDLPGYGYATISRKERANWETMIKNYLTKRENLHCIFVLIDSRHPAQKIDLEFMQWLGETGLPFVVLFTKTDKQSKTRNQILHDAYVEKMLEYWEEMPLNFVTSASAKEGREPILAYIQQLNEQFLV